MARPLSTRKQSVDLASTAARPSRIRREPPPMVKQIPLRDPDEQDRRMTVIGIVTFALALFVVILAFGSASGWSPRTITISF